MKYSDEERQRILRGRRTNILVALAMLLAGALCLWLAPVSTRAWFWLGVFLGGGGLLGIAIWTALLFFPDYVFRAMERYEEPFEKASAPKRWFP